MGKKPQSNKNRLPLVSVCTPTFNRRPFIQTMFECFRQQTYPKSRIEWIIVDDGTDKIGDLIASSNIPQIQYFPLEMKLALGAKRNYMHEKAKGSIIVYMDDDDYYPPDRIMYAVETLQKNPKALAVGSSEMYIYFKHIQTMYQCGPYGPNHATAGTFAFRRELLYQTQYDADAAIAEEKVFLKNYTVPFAQLDPMKTILVFSHEHNTFDKRKLLEHGENKCFKVSTKKVEDFISLPKGQKIYDFFMKNIDALLEKYEPGHPKSKPEVSVQMKEIEEKRKIIDQELSIMRQQMQSQMMPQIMMDVSGEKKPMSPQDIVNCIQTQQKQIQMLMAKVQHLEKTNAQLQQIVRSKLN